MLHRRRVTKLSALLRLAIVIVKVTGFSFHRRRIADGINKRQFLAAIRCTCSHIGVRMVLRATGLPEARYHNRHGERCAFDVIDSCPRSFRQPPAQMPCQRETKRSSRQTVADAVGDDTFARRQRLHRC